MCLLEQERKKIYQQGKDVGLTEGEAAGLAKGAEAQRQTLLQFVHWRFHTSEEDQTKVAQKLAQIHSLQQLMELSEHFLRAATLDEFTKQIATYLSSHKPQ
ncbi:MAG: hypothetical protein ACOYNY_44560 [Caldilineaceae bacterium]